MYYNGMSLKEAKGQTNSVFRNLYPSKTQVKNQLIDVDTFTPKLDTTSAQEYLDTIIKIGNGTHETYKTFQEYHDSLDEGTRYIAKYGQETQGQIRSVEGLQQANQNARASIIAQNKAIEQGTLSYKASQVALKGLAMAGNMLAGMLIGMAVSAFVGWIDDMAHAAERAKEASEEFSSSYKDMQNTQRENTATVAELNDEYQKLSQGIDNLGRNVSLSTDEYDRYHEITNQVADLIPDLVQGFDSEGNAILKVKGNLADLNEEYKKTKKNEAAKLYNKKTDDGKNVTEDVVDNLYNNINYTAKSQNYSVDTNDYIDVLDKIATMTYDEIVSMNTVAITSKDSRNRLNTVVTDISSLSAKSLKNEYNSLESDRYLTDTEETLKNVLDVLKQNYSWKEISSMSQDEIRKNYNSLLGNLDLFRYAISDITQQHNATITNKAAYDNGKIENFASTLSNNLNTNLTTSAQSTSERALSYAQGFSDEYMTLSDEQSTIVNSFLGNMSSEFIKSAGITSQQTLEEFVNKFIQGFAKDNSKIAPALSELFAIDLENTDLSPEELQSKVNSLLKIIAEELKVDDVDALKISLGFDVDGLVTNYNNAIDSASKKFKDGDKADLTKFFEDNSINTQAEIDKWNEIANSCNNAAETKRKYLQVSSQQEDNSIKSFAQAFNSTIFSETKENLLNLAKSGEITSEVLDSTEEYKKLLNDTGLTAEQAMNKILAFASTDLTNDISDYESLLNKIRNGQSLSAEEVAKYINKNSDLAGSLVKVKNGFSFEEDAIVSLLNTSIESRNVVVSSQIEQTKTTIKQTSTRIKEYKKELEALLSIAIGYETMSTWQADTGMYLPGDAWDSNATPDEIKAQEDKISKEEKNLKKNKNKLKALEKELDELLKSSTGSGGSGSSTKSSKSTVSQTFNWIETKIDHLETKVKRTVDKITDYTSKETKDKLFNRADNQYDTLISAETKAAKKYKKKADNVDLPSKWKKKVRKGDYSIETLKGEEGGKNDKLIQQIEKYQEYWDKYQNKLDDIETYTNEKRQNIKNKLEDDIENYEFEIESLQSEADRLEGIAEANEIKGFSMTESDYRKQIENSNAQIEQWENEKKAYENYLKTNNIKESSAEYQDIQSKIKDIDANIQNAQNSQLEWNKSISELPYQNLEKLRTLLDSIISRYKKVISLWQAQGNSKTQEQIKTQIFMGLDDISVLEDSKSTKWTEIFKLLDENGWTSSNLKEAFKDTYEAWQSGEISKNDFYTRMSDLGISKDVFDSWDGLQEKLDEVNDIEGNILDNKTSIENYFDELFDNYSNALQVLIDKLNEMNNAKSKAIELEKLQQALQAAKQNKTALVYHEGYGFNYEADRTSINDAQNNLDDYYAQEQVDLLQKIIDWLNDHKDDYNFFDADDNMIYSSIEEAVAQVVTDIGAEAGKILGEVLKGTPLFTTDSNGQIVANLPKYAKGTTSAKGGLSLVGEKGAELRILNEGDSIIPHDVTENLLKFGFNPEQMIKDNMNIKFPDYSSLVVSKNESSPIFIDHLDFPGINDKSTIEAFTRVFTELPNAARQFAHKNI